MVALVYFQTVDIPYTGYSSVGQQAVVFELDE